MKVLQVALPSQVQISSKADVDEVRNFICNKGFAVIDEYKDSKFKNNCTINYDLKILLATIKG
jgi:hypothetical protein